MNLDWLEELLNPDPPKQGKGKGKNPNFKPVKGRDVEKLLDDIYKIGYHQYRKDAETLVEPVWKRPNPKVPDAAEKLRKRTWGEIQTPVGISASQAYGSQTQAVFDALARERAAGTGGAMAAIDMTTPTVIRGGYIPPSLIASASNPMAWHDPSKPGTIGGNFPGPGGLGAIMEENAEHRSRIGFRKNLNEFQLRNVPNAGMDIKSLSDNLMSLRLGGREEINHAVGSMARAADPQNSWETWVKAQKFPKDDKDFPIMSWLSAVTSSAYFPRVEEARAKLQMMAQDANYHPLLHPKGVQSGIDELVRQIEKKYTPKGSKKPLVPEHYYYYLKALDSPDSKVSKSMREFLEQVFRNFAAVNKTQDTTTA